MRCSLLVLLMSLLLGPVGALADEKKAEEPLDQPAAKPKSLSVEQAADAVLAAVKAKDNDALKALAENDEPDPWLVADQLCFRGEHDAAAAFANRVEGKVVERLPAYVESRRGKGPEHPARQLEMAMRRAVSNRKPSGAIDLAPDPPPDADTVTKIQIAFVRGLALQLVRRRTEAVSALLVVSRQAEALGWLVQAMRAARFAGSTAFAVGDWVSAEEAWGARTRLGREVGMGSIVADSILRVGITYERRGQPEMALTFYREALAIQRRRGDQAGMAVALNSIGICLKNQGELDEAMSAYAEALSLRRSLGNKAAIARTNTNIGAIHESEDRFEAAMACYEESLVLARESRDRPTEANTLYNMAIVFERTGRHRESLGPHEEALRIRTELGDRQRIADSLARIALVRQRLGERDVAVKRFEQLLELTRALGDRARSAGTLIELGWLHASLRRPEAAQRCYEEALGIMRALGDPVGVASVITNMGTLWSNEGQLRKALQYYEESLEMARGVNHEPTVARTLHNIGMVHQRLGNTATALKYHEEALILCRRLDLKGDTSTVLSGLARLESDLGRFDDALRRAQESLKYTRDIGHEAVLTDRYLMLGDVQLRLGNYAEAVAMYEAGQEIAVRLGFKPDIAKSIHAMASVEMYLGHWEEGLAKMSEALRLFREIDDPSHIAAALKDTAIAQRELGHNSEARVLYEESLELGRSLGDARLAAAALMGLGLLQQDAGESAQAIETFRKVLAIRDALGDVSSSAGAWTNIAGVQAGTGALELAEASFQQAFTRLEESPHRDFRVRTLGGLAEVLLLRGRHEEALARVREAIALVQQGARGLAEGEGAGNREAYFTVFDAGYRAASLADDPKSLVALLEQGHATSMREVLGSRQLLEAVTLPPASYAALGAARDAELRAYEAYRMASGLQESRAARSVWREAQTEVTRVSAKIQRETKRVASLSLDAPDDLERIQARLEDDEALVYLCPTTREGLALIVRRSGARRVVLASAEEIAGAVQALLAGERHVDPAGIVALRKVLVDPLGLSRDVKRLLVAPMGMLSLVPPSLLFPDRVVTCVPSGTIYGLLHEEKALRGEKILGFGDPDYRARAQRASPRARAGGPFNLVPLPETRREVESIADVSVVGKDASETEVPRAIARRERWRAVHFACHGLVDPERPMVSSLALTRDAENDGFLTVREILGLRVPADLVVLSACETGTGKVYRTEGILGLTRAFMFAGAPRVICSLWKVDDEATQALMVKFYELWNPKDGKTGLSCAAALKKAQEYVRGHLDKNGKRHWEHPYYWAAWVLWGLPD